LEEPYTMPLDVVEITAVDDETSVICLELPPSKVVILQGAFELLEGIGILRTLDTERALICVITTPSLVRECVDVLNALQEAVLWRVAEVPPDVTFLGDFEKDCYD
jgi:hypothetical protein